MEEVVQWYLLVSGGQPVDDPFWIFRSELSQRFIDYSLIQLEACDPLLKICLAGELLDHFLVF